jgi:hypothetical protein
VEVPELKSAIESGQVHLSNARRIVPVLTQENKNEWLLKAETLTSRQLQKELATHSPKLATVEKATYVNRDRLQIQHGMSEETYQEFLNVQNLVSQKKQAHADFEETLKELISFYKKHNDPVLKAERALLRKIGMTEIGTEKTRVKEMGMKEIEMTEIGMKETERKETEMKEIGTKEMKTTKIGMNKTRMKETRTRETKKIKTITTSERKHEAPRRGLKHVKQKRKYPALLEHQINLRDQRQCTHQDKGKRCEERRWLEFHHIIEIENGGPDTLENLTTLCWAHHQMRHATKSEVRERQVAYQSA